MQPVKEIAALLESGKVEVLRHGAYQPYSITAKYGAAAVDEEDLVLLVKCNHDTPIDNT